MIRLTLKRVQDNWLEATWHSVETVPDKVVPAKPALFDANGKEVEPATPEKVVSGGEKLTEIQHISYHPTQVDMLKADVVASKVELSTEQAALIEDWVDSYVPPEPTPEVIVVPTAVTMRQARLALLKVGKLSLINQAIANLPSPQKEAAEIEWEYSQEVQRHNGFVSLLAPLLGMTDNDLDTLFVMARKL